MCESFNYELEYVENGAAWKKLARNVAEMWITFLVYFTIKCQQNCLKKHAFVELGGEDQFFEFFQSETGFELAKDGGIKPRGSNSNPR